MSRNQPQDIPPLYQVHASVKVADQIALGNCTHPTDKLRHPMWSSMSMGNRCLKSAERVSPLPPCRGIVAINKDNIHSNAAAQRVEGRLVKEQSRVTRTGLGIFHTEHLRDAMSSNP